MFGFWRPYQNPILQSKNLRVRYPMPADFAMWREARLQSANFLRPFEPRSSIHDVTRQGFARRIRRARLQARKGHEHLFFIFDMSGGEEVLVGGLTLSNIRLRAARHANLGYWMSVNHANNGYMSRAVKLCLTFAFEELNLYRIHAASLPDNKPSRRVLEKNGFVEEGFAKQYLQIDGKWQDHVLYGLTKARHQNIGN